MLEIDQKAGIPIKRKRSPYKIVLLIISPIIIITFFIVFILLFATPFSPLQSWLVKSEYRASSITQLKRDLSWNIILANITKDDWDKLEIAGKLDNLENVVYVYEPARGESSAGGIKAEVKFNKNINSDTELKQLFNNALIASGISPLQGYPGGYCFKRTSQGYFKTDILYIGSNDDFPRKDAFVYLDYGDSWKSCQVQFNM